MYVRVCVRERERERVCVFAPGRLRHACRQHVHEPRPHLVPPPMNMCDMFHSDVGHDSARARDVGHDSARAGASPSLGASSCEHM